MPYRKPSFQPLSPILVLVMLLGFTNIRAQKALDTIDLLPNQEGLRSISSQVLWFSHDSRSIDVSRPWAISSLIGFEQQSEDAPNFRSNLGEAWAYFPFKNQTEEQPVLEVTLATLDTVVLYGISEGQKPVRLFEVGGAIPQARKWIRHNYCTLPLNPNYSYFLLRLVNKHGGPVRELGG